MVFTTSPIMAEATPAGVPASGKRCLSIQLLSTPLSRPRAYLGCDERVQRSMAMVAVAADDGLLAGLNPEQREAVLTTDGPVMVIAGAGTGKTTVLTRRLAHLLATGRAQPWEVLAVTFTNKAAREMRHRVERLVGTVANQVRMGTFHSVSMEMLRHHARAAGLRDDRFQVLDTDDQLALVDAVVEQLGLADAEASKKERRDWARKMHGIITGWKEAGHDLAAVQAKPPKDLDGRMALEIFAGYQDALVSRNACDFADLLLYMVGLFHTEPNIKARWAERIRYLLVDEFQDTNDLQYEWLRHLASVHGNITVVGDIDQSIYQWRSARPELMLNFQRAWPGCKTVVVDRNYRSTRQILEVANRVVEANPRPAPKSLRSERDGKPVACRIFATEQDEAEAVARAVVRRIAAGTDPRQIAVLYRSAALMLVLEKALSRQGVAYAVVGGQKFYEREEVKDALCYLRVAADPRDDLAFGRIANKPSRNIGDAARQQVVEALHRGEPTLAAACRTVAASGARVARKTKDALVQLSDLLDHLAARAGTDAPADILTDVLQRTDYIAWRKAMRDENLLEREENLKELVADAGGYTDLATYLQSVSLTSDADKEQVDRSVRVSTVHAAKGLEFDVVYTPGLEDGILPNARALREPWGEAEERRICHVAWTRPRHELIVSCAAMRRGTDAFPSRFLSLGGLRPVAGQPLP